MKKAIALLAAAVMLVSCSSQDNSGNVHETDNSEFVSIQKLFDGYDELTGMEHRTFSLPEKISLTAPENIYALEVVPREKANVESDGQKLFSSLVPEGFSSGNCRWDENNYFYTYNDEHYTAQFTGSLLTFSSDKKTAGEMSSENLSEHFDVAEDSDKPIMLGIDTISVGEMCSIAEKYLNEKLGFLVPEFEIKVNDIFPYKAANENRVRIISALYCEGIPVEEYISPTLEISNDQIKSYYNCMIDMIMTAPDECILLNMFSIPKVSSKESKDKIIGIKEAVGLLDSSLAEYTSYSFDDIKLMYCGLLTQPVIDATNGDYEAARAKTEEFEAIPKRLEPTWCFIIDNKLSGFSRQIIKLNALTGEITMNIHN